MAKKKTTTPANPLPWRLQKLQPQESSAKKTAAKKTAKKTAKKA